MLMHIYHINEQTDRQTNGQTDGQNDINTYLTCPDLRNDHVILGHVILGHVILGHAILGYAIFGLLGLQWK